MRRSATNDVTVLVAKLRNDKESRYTEDLLQWIKQQGYQYFELGRSWREEEGKPKLQRPVRRRLTEATVWHYWKALLVRTEPLYDCGQRDDTLVKRKTLVETMEI